MALLHERINWMYTRVGKWWGLLVMVGVLVLPLTRTAQADTGNATLPRGGVYQHPITVMIDNHVDAVPQSGFHDAAVVFEALAEGGITRFMLVFNGDAFTPNAIGPVRSTRLYYAQLALGFKAVHVHAGGSPQGLALMANNTQAIDIDALRRGTAVLANDVPVLREVGGPAASYADAQDAHAFSEALRRLLEAPSDTASEQRRAWARQFTWDRSADGTARVLLAALEESHAQR
jgi:hypothetical protein